MLRLATVLILFADVAMAAGSAPAVNTDLGCTVAGEAYQYSGSAMTCSTPLRPSTTVASLPTCDAAARGKMFIVTNALLPASLAIVAAGGAVVVGVTCNGTNWIVQ